MGANNKKCKDSYLKKLGIDAEAVKAEYFGKNGGRYDIYFGKTVTIERKDGRHCEDTHYTIEQFVAIYSTKKEKTL